MVEEENQRCKQGVSKEFVQGTIVTLFAKRLDLQRQKNC